jgi:hypothetical protein
MAFGVITAETDFQTWQRRPYKHRSAPFASTIFIELHRDEETQERYLRYIYNGRA